MSLNTNSKAYKAAVKRKQRARIKAGTQTEVEKARSSDLLQEIIDMGDSPPQVKAVARLAKKNMGSPHIRLRPALASRIIRYVLEGNHLATACRAAGVRDHQFRIWMRQAEACIAEAEKRVAETAEAEWQKIKTAEAVLRSAEADEDADPEMIEEAKSALESAKQAIDELVMFDFVSEDRLLHVQLNQAVLIAEAHAEMALLRKAGKGKRGWQASMTILERRYRDGWGKKSEVDHRVSGDKDKPILIAYESDDLRKKRVANILQSSGVIDAEAEEIESLDSRASEITSEVENSRDSEVESR